MIASLAYDWPRLHAAVNDLPAALLTAAVLFDLAALLRKRESLAWASTWTLWLGVLGGWVAVLAGNQAEGALDHGTAIHELMEQHETIALVAMIAFTVVLLWKMWRRFELRGGEAAVLRVLSVAALGAMVWTGLLGGRLVFGHAAGIPSSTLETELRNRAAGHEHAPGEEHGHEAADSAAPGDSAVKNDSTKSHSHPPGTKPHTH
jgi:uncharacterized membrane protein